MITTSVVTILPGRHLIASVGLVAAVGLLACGETPPSVKGARCSASQPCAKGLRCSFKEKRCYAPVSCDALAKRLEVCTRELLETYSPKAKDLPSAERVKRIEKIREELRTEVVERCRYDADIHKRDKGTAPTDEKSWGEDPSADALNGCIAKGSCEAFATCFLTVANLLGPGARGRKPLGIFPVALPKPDPGGGAQPPTPATEVDKRPSQPSASHKDTGGKTPLPPARDRGTGEKTPLSPAPGKDTGEKAPLPPVPGKDTGAKTSRPPRETPRASQP